MARVVTACSVTRLLVVTPKRPGLSLLLALRLEKINASVLGWHFQNRLAAVASFRMSAEFYNPERATWESFMEPWSLRVQLLQPQPVVHNAQTLATDWELLLRNNPVTRKQAASQASRLAPVFSSPRRM